MNHSTTVNVNPIPLHSTIVFFLVLLDKQENRKIQEEKKRKQRNSFFSTLETREIETSSKNAVEEQGILRPSHPSFFLFKERCSMTLRAQHTQLAPPTTAAAAAARGVYL